MPIIDTLRTWDTGALEQQLQQLHRLKRVQPFTPQDAERLDAVVHLLQSRADALRERMLRTCNEGSLEERRRQLNAAVHEAQKAGIVVTEEGGDLSADRTVHLIAAGHYGAVPVDPTIRQSSVQQFTLLHLMKKHGARTPFLPEGMTVFAEKPTRGFVDLGRFKNRNFYDDDMQEYAATHPTKLGEMLDFHHQRYGIPHIHKLTSYPHVYGVHELSTIDKLDWVYERVGIEQSFPSKYFASGSTQQPWTEERDGQWIIHFGTRILSPREVVADCDAFIQYAQDLKDIDTMRERELVTRLDRERDLEPMAYVGLGHEKSVVQLCAQTRLRVVSIIPTAALPARGRMETGNLAEHNLPVVRQLRDWAAQYVTA